MKKLKILISPLYTEKTAKLQKYFDSINKVQVIIEGHEGTKGSVEIIASGVLALSAPAGYWVSLGNPDQAGWLLFLLTWLQSAASIVYAYLRLEQRNLEELPTLPERIRKAQRSLAYSTFNILFVAFLAIIGSVPQLILNVNKRAKK